MIRTIVVMASFALLAACATATPYQPAGRDGTPYGYSDRQIEQDRFRVSFSGNALTNRETVEDFLLYRAAELTLQRGYDYFTVADRGTEADRRYRASSFGGFRSRWGFYPYYSFYTPMRGWYDPWGPWGGGFRDFDVRETTRYIASAEIKMGRGPVPADPNTFDARQVQMNLSGVGYPPAS